MDRHPGYDEDFFAWTQDQARLLREAAAERTNTPIDWDKLAEEVEGVGRSELSAVESALMRVMEHLLKLEFSPAADPRAGWKASVIEHRARAAKDLKASPSLRNRIDLDGEYATARDLAALGLARDGVRAEELPEACPYGLDRLLDRAWWPANRRGLED
ncbi:DUF29 domain-containing protein [Azospirillum sp. RWY-5-1]|uniref:DUF29 domain-containing protein n=1 Tax=Azospirillum oleiclasticum TaxID=2735135 RepID=A0ABX2TBM4_9PROT|nr:DUF29 domain-containing protein [Azospirillum oleiclasticum]NYZ14206.1 DUF29 domain-containing protein [Azospirillum oleiclasticum]NYZ21690.1 DUF29 domain-containing protein [Azospirillum oleiclasticum]